MITPKELRIGSIIWESGLFTPSPEDFNEIIVASINNIDKVVRDDRENGYSFDMLYAIPLTAEWLLKFGFVESNSYSDKARHFRKDGFSQLADYGGQIIILPEGGFASVSCGYYENEIDCPHVHRLQNLYYALTGEELTIKELQS